MWLRNFLTVTEQISLLQDITTLTLTNPPSNWMSLDQLQEMKQVENSNLMSWIAKQAKEPKGKPLPPENSRSNFRKLLTMDFSDINDDNTYKFPLQWYTLASKVAIAANQTDPIVM